MNIRIDICVDNMRFVTSEVAYCLRNLADHLDEHGCIQHLRPKEGINVVDSEGNVVGSLTKKGKHPMTLKEVFSKETK